MNNLQRTKIALEYLEKHISDNIQLKDVAKVAGFSEYHFHRMFRALTGFTIKDYIRKRRLYLAAEDILKCVDTIANTALKYQFSSQASFSVAFKHLHGITPGMIRKNEDYKVFGKLILNDIELCRPKALLKEPTLVEVKSFSVIGKEVQVKYSQLENFHNPIIQLWNQKDEFILDNKMPYYVVYEYDPKNMQLNDSSFTYLLGSKINDKSERTNCLHKSIHAGSFLLFQVNIEETGLYDIYDYIDEQWLPLSDYILSDQVDFEIHHCNEAENTVDIYISIEEQK